MAVLIVHGFALREGRNKWACCYEIRMVSGHEQALLYRGELHGRAFVSEHAAIVAACEAGELEAKRRIAAGLAAGLAAIEPTAGMPLPAATAEGCADAAPSASLPSSPRHPS